jgi:hypothetical protein
VEARFLAVDDERLAALQADVADLFRGDVKPSEPGKPSSGAVVFLSEAQLDAIMKVATAKPSTVVTAPRITIFNGQRAYVMVGTQRAYVKSLTISKDKDGKTSYEPVVDVVNFGIIFDVQGTLSADRKNITLGLRPKLSTLVALRDVPFPNAPPGENLSVQQPDVQTSEMKTTVTVPDQKTILLRGLTGAMTLKGGADEPQPMQNLLILVKPTAIIQREFPASASPEGPAERRRPASDAPANP